MATSILVERDLADGERLLTALEQGRLPIVAAFWRLPAAHGDGRLVIASPLVDRAGSLPVYQRIQAALDRLPEIHFSLSEIVAVGEQDPIVVRLRQAAPTNGARGPFTTVTLPDFLSYVPYVREDESSVTLYVYRLVPSADGSAAPT